MKLQTLILSASLSFLTPVCSAGQPSPDFQTIISSVIANNPDLASQAESARAAGLSLGAENNLQDPEVEFDRAWGTTADTGNKWGLSVSQSFEWPGVYAARNKAARAGRSALQREHEAKVLDKELETRLLLLDIVNANKQVDALTRISANMDSLIALTDRMYASGNAAILDVRKLQFERFNLSVQLDDALNEVSRLSADLAALNGGEAIDTEGLRQYPGQIFLSEREYLEAADPTLLAMTEAAEASRLTARAEGMKRFPGFSVGYVHETEGDENFNGFSVGLTLPVFSTRNNKKAAEAEALARSYELDGLRLARRSAIISDVRSAVKMKRQIDAYHEIFEKDDYLALLERAYRGGQMSQHVYLGEVNDYLRLCMDHLAMLLNYHRTLATLNRTAGLR